MKLFGFETVIYKNDVSIINKNGDLVLVRIENLSPKTILSQIPVDEIQHFCKSMNIIVTQKDADDYRKEESVKAAKAKMVATTQVGLPF